MRRFRALAAVLILVGCTPPAPTPPPNAVVHFRNHVDNALLVGVTSGDQQLVELLQPCGGSASITVPVPPEDDPRVQMGAIHDTHGNLDDIAEHWGPDDDAADLVKRTIWGAAIIWSTGEIGIDDMPAWVTFTPGATDVAATEPAATVPSECEPWPPLPEDD